MVETDQRGGNYTLLSASVHLHAFAESFHRCQPQRSTLGPDIERARLTGVAPVTAIVTPRTQSEPPTPVVMLTPALSVDMPSFESFIPLPNPAFHQEATRLLRAMMSTCARLPLCLLSLSSAPTFHLPPQPRSSQPPQPYCLLPYPACILTD